MRALTAVSIMLACVIPVIAATSQTSSRPTAPETFTANIQAYGATAIIYTSYELDVLEGGRTRTERGKATEVFVRRAGKWLNTGWQLAPDPPARQER